MAANQVAVQTMGQQSVYDFGNALVAQSQGQRKSARTRAAIQHAGCRLLDGGSLMSLTVATICAEAGIAHGTFYIYFADRQAFVADLLSRFVDYVQDVLRHASKADDANPVRATTAAYYQLFKQNPGILRCLTNHLDDFPVSKNAFQKLNREWATTVVASAERQLLYSGRAGEVSHPELMRRAYALGGMVDQYLSSLFLNQDQSLVALSVDQDAVVDTLSHIWEQGMMP